MASSLIVILFFWGTSWAFRFSPSTALIAETMRGPDEEKLAALVKLLGTEVPKVETAVGSSDVPAIQKVMNDFLSAPIPIEDVLFETTCVIDKTTAIDADVLKNFQTALALLQRGNKALENAKAGKYKLKDQEAEKEVDVLSQVIADSSWTTSDCTLLLKEKAVVPDLSVSLVETQAKAKEGNQVLFKSKTNQAAALRWLLNRVIDLIYAVPRLWAATVTDALLIANGLPWLLNHYRVYFAGPANSAGRNVSPNMPNPALIRTPSLVHPRTEQITLAVGRHISLITAGYVAHDYHWVVRVDDGITFPINYLPYTPDMCTWMFLDVNIHSYITASLSGCSLFLATRVGHPPIVMHCNANTVVANRIAAGDTPAQANLVGIAQKQTDANNVLLLNPGYAIVQTITKPDYNGGIDTAFGWGSDATGQWQIHVHHFNPLMIGRPINTPP